MKPSIKTLAAAIIIGGAMSTAAMAQTPGEVANFSRYLDSHPEVAQRLAADPHLADNPQFLADHQGLQAFMNRHPGVSAQLHSEPRQFINREGHYEWARGGPIASAPGTAAGPLSRFDNGYLDQHPEVARQLGHDPRLVDNPQFRASHPRLDSYLAAHPGVRTELQQHPDRFMGAERRDDRWGTGQGPHPLANTDHYLDRHPEVAGQLNSNPRLIDNRQYVDNHPGLHQFLANHPTARSEWKSHPYRYTARENHYDKRH